jgi:hypothetical protein
MVARRRPEHADQTRRRRLIRWCQDGSQEGEGNGSSMGGPCDLPHALTHVRDTFEHLISLGNGERMPTSEDSDMGGGSLDVLESMEDTLTQQRNSSPAVAHALNQLHLVDFSLDDSIAGRQRQASFDCLLVSFHASNKALQLANLAGSHPFEPVIKLLSRARPEHMSELLDQVVG